MSQEVLIWGIGLPAVCCAALLLVVLRPWQGAPGGAAGWAAANALAAGFVVSYLVIRDWEIDLPPKRPWEWLAYLVVLIAIVLGYGLSVGGRGKSAWTGWIFASGLCAYLIVGTRVDQFWAWRIVTAAMMVASMSGLDRLREQTDNGVFPLSIGLAAVGACLVLMESRNEALAQMAGALAACLGVIAIMSWWQSSITLGAGGVLVVGMLLPGLAMSGYFAGAKLPVWCFLLAALAPAAFWLTEVPGAPSFMTQKPTEYGIGAVVATAAAAVAFAMYIS
jgi:hypothetical protein